MQEAKKKIEEEEKARIIKEKLEKEDALKNGNKENPESTAEKKEEDEDDKVEEGKVKPVNNGSKTDKYVWTQTLEEVRFKLKIGPSLYPNIRRHQIERCQNELDSNHPSDHDKGS